MSEKAKTNIKKIGRLMVEDGKYIDKDGNEKKKWHEIGIVFSTPHHSRMVVKLHSNGFGTGQFANVFYDDGCKPNFTDKESITVKGAEDYVPEDKEIPF